MDIVFVEFQTFTFFSYLLKVFSQRWRKSEQKPVFCHFVIGLFLNSSVQNQFNQVGINELAFCCRIMKSASLWRSGQKQRLSVKETTTRWNKDKRLKDFIAAFNSWRTKRAEDDVCVYEVLKKEKWKNQLCSSRNVRNFTNSFIYKCVLFPV